MFCSDRSKVRELLQMIMCEFCVNGILFSAITIANSSASYMLNSGSCFLAYVVSCTTAGHLSLFGLQFIGVCHETVFMFR